MMIDLNQLPIDEHEAIFMTETSIYNRSQSQPIEVDKLEPFVGQTFLSEEEAFVYYQNYARLHGFSIRKDRTQNKDGKVVRRDFYCHRGGSQPLKEINPNKEQRNRLSSKCKCNAHMRIKWRRSNEIFPEEWHVTTFVANHNHSLLLASQTRFLSANRVISTEDEKRILLLKDAGLVVRQIIRVLELEKNVKHGDLPFLERDVRNLFSRINKSVCGNDVMNLLDFFKCCKKQDPKFRYVYTVDQEKKFEHLFWSPAQCFDWYDKFGDVVVFDTTYKVNIYGMPCAIFVGVNSHGNTVLFGFALLRNETTDTFKWLMKTFKTVMKKSPKTIITDQDSCMTEAIATELPFTKHFFCIWHITYKFSGWFAPVLRTEYQKWCKDFYALYKLEAVEDFESQWALITAKYNLQDNKHIKGLYEIKHSWAPAYLRGYYFGGMTTTGRSEYINGFIKRFISSNYTLCDLAKQIEVVVQEIMQKQSHDNMLAVSKMEVFSTKSPLEQQVSQILTPFAFQKFKEEYQRASQYVIANKDGHDFILKYYEPGNSRSRRVFWDGKIAMCSCKQFEFLGILCRHILRVFIQTDCNNIPSSYLPIRWQLQGQSINHMVDVSEILRDDDTILCPPQSITKGRPRNKRLKGGKELAKQVRRCSVCRNSGHYVNNCPANKENEIVFNGTRRKKKKVASNDTNVNPVFSMKN
ncbi:protein FAR1-RELATED SEQUENCE 11-like [Silene latifolia]|uniref:protein FAR1-RELATED SEQUENCE 11-like n=1 Tax=Silene latifolia TaxID=37657 RepID=UPI003D7831B4